MPHSVFLHMHEYRYNARSWSHKANVYVYTTVALSGSHHTFEPEFPGVHFLGKPQEVAVQPEQPVTISPPGVGATLSIPAGALQSAPDTPANVTLRTCLPTSSFTYPEGCTPLSAVYHLSADSDFEKKVDLTFEHHAKVENEEEAKEVVLFQAKSSPMVADGEVTFEFTAVEDGDFAVGEGHCTVSTQQFGFMCVGVRKNANIRKS